MPAGRPGTPANTGVGIGHRPIQYRRAGARQAARCPASGQAPRKFRKGDARIAPRPGKSYPEGMIAVTGSSGLVGRALCAALEARGDAVVRLVRRDATNSGERRWGLPGGPDLTGVRAVIHLAGESIASGLWSPARKRRIRESRVAGTRAIAEACARHEVPRLVCASAVGWYGDRAEEQLDETSRPGTGFLAEVCQAWEDATEPARKAGIAVAHARFGQILSWSGGSLAVQAQLYRWGLGARLGSGRQWMPWISLEDAVTGLLHLIDKKSEGPFNFVSPMPCRQLEFHQLMARHFHRLTFPVAPSLLLRLLPGGFGRELLLASAHIRPACLTETEFVWKAPDLATVLKRA